MVEWSSFGVVGSNFVTYLFGSYLAFGIVISIIFLIVLMTAGLEFKYSIVLTLPLLGLFSLAGWLGNATWALNALLLVISLIYAFAMIKLLGR